MALSKKELRKEVRAELCEALRFSGRAANLLRHASKNQYMSVRNEKALDTAEALEKILASTTEHIDHLLSE